MLSDTYYKVRIAHTDVLCEPNSSAELVVKQTSVPQLKQNDRLCRAFFNVCVLFEDFK